jgi:hypothetical protein
MKTLRQKDRKGLANIIIYTVVLVVVLILLFEF